MKQERPKVNVTVGKKRTEFDKLYARRLMVEAQLRSLNSRLRHAHEWLPMFVMMHPDRKPADVLKGLRGQQLKLMETFADLRAKGAGERPVEKKKPSIPGAETFPDIEKLNKAIAIAKVIDRDHLFQEGHAVLAQGPAPPNEPWSGTLWAYDWTAFEDITWSDDDATFSGEWAWFDPNLDITRGILAMKGWVDVPPPFDWPIYEEPGHHAQLAKTAAMTFNVPPPTRDCLVYYEARLLLGLNPYFDADQWCLFVDSLLCVQPDASAAMPSGLVDFNVIDPRITLADELEPRIKSSYLSGSYIARAGVLSRVHLGMHWNLSMTNGCGGTSGGWDNFIILTPAGSDIWGLKVAVVPL